MSSARPVLYSFRRCPYAMRARLALASAGIECELREIVLRDKAPEFLQTSPKGTVPVLAHADLMLEESFDVMVWALDQNDPEAWRDMPEAGYALIKENDCPFKSALDRYKYSTRYGSDPVDERDKASVFLRKLDGRLTNKLFLCGDKPRLADMAILPFIRQFANTDRAWFEGQGWPDVRRWLGAFEASERFAAIMVRYDKWCSGDPAVLFPDGRLSATS